MLLNQVMNDSYICQCWQVIKNVQDYIKTMEHGLLVFRYEPFILALECRTPASAQILVTCALSAGFRESGILFIYLFSLFLLLQSQVPENEAAPHKVMNTRHQSLIPLVMERHMQIVVYILLYMTLSLR